MKAIFLVLGLLCTTWVSAQVTILSTQEAEQQGLTRAYWDSLVQSKSKKVARNPPTIRKEDDAFLKNQMIIGQKIFGIRENALMGYQMYVSEDKKINYLIYKIEGTVSEANKNRFLDSLKVLTDAYVAELKLSNFFVSHHFIRLGIFRSITKGKGVISTLELAETTTRPDTVKILALNQLQLQQVPECIYRFAQLQELNLSGNELTAASIDLARLPKLRQIWLNQNQLTNNSLQLTSNKTLRILNIQNNRFTDIPEAVSHCRRLTSLWLGYNKLEGLNPDVLKKLRRLQDLNLYSCELKSLPDGISKLRRLEVLDLYYNELTTLPTSLSRMRRLQQLAISHNQFSELPTHVGRLRRLRALYAHHNRLHTLPTSIKKLRRTKIFDIGYNQFSTLPKQIGQLRKVEELDLSYNNLSEVPNETLQLRQLKKLYLRNNPFANDSMLMSRSKSTIESLEENRIQVAY